MAFAKRWSGNQTSVELKTRDRVTLMVVGGAVIFASLGLGEAVYRLAFFDFDGATDRLPIEMLFGLTFAWMVMKLVKKLHQSRLETTERIHLVWHRNNRIRDAVEALPPAPYPVDQQAVRVIREEVDRIELALTDILPRSARDFA